MICPISLPRLAWSCVTNMFWDTNQVISCKTVPGEKSRSAWSRPGACRLSTSTPRQGTTPPTSSPSRFFILLGLLLLTLAAAPAGRSQQPAQPAPPSQPQESQSAKQGSGDYAIRSDVNLVVLHVSVLNERKEFVPGLMEDNFHVLEDKVDQKISVFRQEDVPVSMGLVIDNSGSMREKRASDRKSTRL